MNLDNDAVKEKFLDGMPEFMEAIKVHHKNDNNLVHPANYPGYFPAKLRGTPHPQAGEPDIIAIARIIYRCMTCWECIHTGSGYLFLVGIPW